MYLGDLESGQFNDIVSGIEFDKENKFSLQYIARKIRVSNKGYEFYMNDLLENYREIIFNDLIELSVRREAYYLPELVSKLLYGTTDLWYLILFCNNMYSKYQFTKGIINVLSAERLVLLNHIIESNKSRLLENKENPFEAVDITLVKIL